MYIYMYIYIHIYLYVYIYIYTCVRMYVRRQAGVYVCIHAQGCLFDSAPDQAGRVSFDVGASETASSVLRPKSEP